MSTLGGGPNIARDGLVLNFDAANIKSYPGSGTLFSDLSLSGYDALIANSPIFSNENNGIFTFDGIDDKIYIPVLSVPNLNPETFDYTLCSWLNFGAFTG